LPPRAIPDAEHDGLVNWPEEISRADLVSYFTLTVDDARWLRSYRSPRAAADRIGLAVQLCALRFLGFVPAGLSATPPEVVRRLVGQLGVPATAFTRYVAQVSGRSRREHVGGGTSRVACVRTGRVEGPG
jgi:Domain of unknown function (DUF4158)